MIEWLIGGVIVIIAAYVFLYFTYFNRIRTFENQIDEAWAQIDVQLKKRFDLVPNLVETVKGYAKHEREIFERVSQARAGMVTGTPQQRMEASNQLSAALRTVFAVAEAYPQLKANEQFKLLQEQLEGIENKIAYSRQYFNNTVLNFNNLITTFPGIWFAGGRNKREFLAIPESERQVPKVQF
ncbi:LemA family protein [Candidatus Bathyarchaeota archaeon]|nr:LemA family protein [Candidatus Bathyarchaeota archaeon]